MLRESGHLIIPVAAILAVIYSGYSAPLAALVGTILCFPVAALRASTRSNVTVENLIGAMVDGARNTLAVALACASAGIVIAVVTLSGLGIVFTQFVVHLAKDMLLVALVLTMIAGIVLGMGIPTTPAYIIMTALLVPAIVKLGVIEPAAHMFAFYFAILSAITPPVALAVFAAAGIAKSDLWSSGWSAVKIGAAGFIVPLYVRLLAVAADDRRLADHRFEFHQRHHRRGAVCGRTARLPDHGGQFLAAADADRRRPLVDQAGIAERYRGRGAGADRDRDAADGAARAGQARDRGGMSARKRPQDLRSHRWLGVNDLRAFGHRSRLRQGGFDAADFTGKPVIGILNTWSDINFCHTHLRARAEDVKRGILQAGGFPIELPAMSLSEPFVKPSTMLYRNLLAMEAEELLRSHPIDGAVLWAAATRPRPA